MTPKEEAVEIFALFYDLSPNEAFFNEPLSLTEHYSKSELAKKSALIAVDKILKLSVLSAGFHESCKHMRMHDGQKPYWLDVKKEIRNINI